MSKASYSIVDISLAVALAGKLYIEGTQGTNIVAVYPVAASAGAPLVPASTDVKLYWGEQDGYQIAENWQGTEFPCGHTGGIAYSIPTALAGGTLRLQLVYGNADNVS